MKQEQLEIQSENNVITSRIIGAAIRVHQSLGPGLLESAYQDCLYYELSKDKNLNVQTEVLLPLVYEDLIVSSGYRVDLLVDNKVVVELKAVDKCTDVHYAQILTYMRLGGYRTGLLINFNVRFLKSGIRRFAL